MSRTWSEYQLAVFNAFARGTGNLVIEAVAGSGKTTTILEGLKHLPPGKKALMCAFNSATAKTLQERVPPGVDARTFHSLGNGAVMASLGRVQLDDKREQKMAKAMCPTWRAGDIGALVKLVGFAKAWVVSGERQLRDLISQYDCHPSGVSQYEMIERAQEILDESQQNTGTISFDDMVWLPIVLGIRPKQYDVVIIDETQDLNAAQIELALSACRRGGRIIAVGDRRQAIYAFRGADSESMDRLIKRLSATTLPLSVTYRCPRAVVSHVQGIVPQIQSSEDAAEGMVHADVKPHTMMASWSQGDFVLSRVNAPLVRLCLRALRDGIPAFVLGRDLGAQLRALVGRYTGSSVLGLIEFSRQWAESEAARLRADDKADLVEAVYDRADTIVALCDGAETLDKVERRIEVLFDVAGNSARLMFSSTHKAKGMEAPRVWVLEPTYRIGKSVEEDNLYYVACTRAQEQLMLVQYDPRKPN